MKRNRELTRMALQATNNGQDVIIFLRETMDGLDPRVQVCHQLAAARILSRIGLEDGKKFVRENTTPPFRNRKDPLFKIWRSIHGAHAEVYRAARQYTRDGAHIMMFLSGVMNGYWPKFKPNHRLAAARELIRHIEFIPEGDEGDLHINHGLNTWFGEPPTPPNPNPILTAAEYAAAAGNHDYVPSEPAPVKEADIYYRPPSRTAPNAARASAPATKPATTNRAAASTPAVKPDVSKPTNNNAGASTAKTDESNPATNDPTGNAATAATNESVSGTATATAVPDNDKPTAAKPATTSDPAANPAMTDNNDDKPTAAKPATTRNDDQPTENPAANPATTGNAAKESNENPKPAESNDANEPNPTESSADDYVHDCDCGNCQDCYDYEFFLYDYASFLEDLEAGWDPSEYEDP